MKGTYTDLISEKAKRRLTAQYGYGVKRYGCVASWGTMFKCWLLDLVGVSIPQSLKLTKHPAQLHYGIWDKKNLRSWNEAIRRSSSLAFEAVTFRKNRQSVKYLIHFGSGWGGVDIQLCQENAGLHTLGINIDPIQISISEELVRLYNLQERITFKKINFLELISERNKNNDAIKESFDAGIAIESLCHVPKNQFGLLWKNFRYVLKPGARLAIHDWYLGLENKPEVERKLDVFLKGWDMAYCPRVIEISEAAMRNGFKMVLNTNYTPQISKSSEEIYIRTRLFKPIIKLFQNSKNNYIKSLGIEKPEVLDFANTCLIQKELFETGVIKYRQLVFEKISKYS